MTGIYKITSPSGKVYIGKSWNIERRFDQYRRCNKRHVCLYNSLKKYGYENHTFEIICSLPNDTIQQVIDNYELLYWQAYKDCSIKMLNVREPGRGGRLSEEHKKKISKSLIGNKRSLGYKNSVETNEKKRLALMGRPVSEETKQKIRESVAKSWEKRRQKYDKRTYL